MQEAHEALKRELLEADLKAVEQKRLADAALQHALEGQGSVADSAVTMQIARELGSNDTFLIEVIPPLGQLRTPMHICMVVDTSGSMETQAKVDEHGESDGLSMLDIVKHGVNTVIHTLGPSDSLSLVGFSNQATEIFTNIAMDDDGM